MMDVDPFDDNDVDEKEEGRVMVCDEEASKFIKN